MRRLSLTTRLVLLNTCLSTLIICFVWGLLFSISSREIQLNVQNQLEDRVSYAPSLVFWRDGRMEFDSDLLDIENGIYLAIYEQSTQDLVYGRVPYGFDYDLPFESGTVRETSSEAVRYLVLDQTLGNGLIVRGVVSITRAQADFQRALHLSFILFPFLVGLTALAGYLISRRALLPVARITATVESIQQDRDLSRRVHLGEGKDEIYRLAKTFDQLLDTIETGVKREHQFTSDVAHELRTPLTVMLMQCDELAGQPELSRQSREAVALLKRKVQALSEMINQLLLLSRADQGREVLEMEEMDMSDLVTFCVEEMQELAEREKITIIPDIEEGIIMQADETLMIRLMMNLLSNAIQYGKQNGHIEVKLYKEADTIKLEVMDDGIGIAASDLPKIFDRFYRADPSRASSHSGLGLSLVKWIVEAHGGSIQVQSLYGEGTSFLCTFPSDKKRMISGVSDKK